MSLPGGYIARDRSRYYSFATNREAILGTEASSCLTYLESSNYLEWIIQREQNTYFGILCVQRMGRELRNRGVVGECNRTPELT